MFRTKLTLAGFAVAAALGAVAPAALGAHDSWYTYATSLTNQQGSHDPWYANAVSLTNTRHSVPFITDTLGSLGHGMTSVVAGNPVASLTSPPVPAAQHSPSFNWADAAVGAGTAVGGLLVLLGGSLLVARRHSRLAI